MNKPTMNNTPKQLRMSESQKQETYQAAVVAMNFINQKQNALNKYRDEALTYAANNPGNYSFHFNMDFMKVTIKILLGYSQNRFANARTRKWQISDESLKIAIETGASFEEVEELFLSLMNHYIQT